MQRGFWIGAVVVVAILLVVFFMVRIPAGNAPARNETGEPIGGALPQADVPTPMAEPASVPVSVSATGFSSASVTVPVGNSVTFTNADTVPHQVASNPHPTHTVYPPLNGPVLQPGQTFTVPFTAAGTFGYHDHLNPGLTGTVIAQ